MSNNSYVSDCDALNGMPSWLSLDEAEESLSKARGEIL